MHWVSSGRRSEIIRLNLTWIIPAKESCDLPSCLMANLLTSVQRGMSLDEVDVEKAPTSQGSPDGRSDGLSDWAGDRGSHPTTAHKATKFESHLRSFERQLIKYNLEARGIQRVEPHECHVLSWKSYSQIFLMWLSINLAPVNITLGMLAPAVYTLSFKDAALCAVFGAMVGSMAVAYTASWGPVSGNRTLVKLPRFIFGH